MRAKGHAPSAVDANKGGSCWIKIDRIDWTGFGTITAPDAQILLHDDTSALAL
jgi:hypothetical protein